MKMEKKTIAALAILLMAFVVVGPVLAEAPYDVPTQAYVSGSGTPPFFKWKWELPDEDPAPCTQIWPTPFGVKVVTTYMVATDPNGANDIMKVFIKVFHPDGTEKYQIEAEELPKDGEIISAIDQGVLNGCIDPAVAADMKYELGKCEARAWKACFEMHYHQPHGNYKVTAYAVDTAGNWGEFSNTFYYFSLKYLAIDFAGGLDFGEIVPCVEKIISGDTNMGTPQKPTVQSGGNDPLLIKVHFTKMVGTTLGKEIEDFDAKFLGEKLVFKACVWVEFTNPLEACHTEQIDFSVHAPMGTPADTYIGTLHIAIN